MLGVVFEWKRVAAGKLDAQPEGRIPIAGLIVLVLADAHAIHPPASWAGERGVQARPGRALNWQWGCAWWYNSGRQSVVHGRFPFSARRDAAVRR